MVRGTVIDLGTLIAGVDSYIELSFTGGTLAANSQTDEILSYVNKSDFRNYTQSNDYSFDGTRNTETFTDWNKVTLYRNGVLVWGIEPQ